MCQVATHGAVFLVDLLALCNGGSTDLLQPPPPVFLTLPQPPLDVNKGNSANDSGTHGSSTSSSSSSSSSGSSQNSSSGSQNSNGSSGSSSSGGRSSSAYTSRHLTPSALAFSSFLEDIFSSPSILIVGFQLNSDISRLKQSFPWLPCFLTEHSSIKATSSGKAAKDSKESIRKQSGRSRDRDVGTSLENEAADEDGGSASQEAVVLDILEVATAVIPGPVATSLSKLVMQVRACTDRTGYLCWCVSRCCWL